MLRQKSKKFCHNIMQSNWAKKDEMGEMGYEEYIRGKKRKNYRHSQNLKEMMMRTDINDQYVTKKKETKNMIHELKKV